LLAAKVSFRVHGRATVAELNSPYGVAIDAFGNLYIADTNNNVIREVNAATGVITAIAGNGTQGYLGDGGLAANCELTSPDGVAEDEVTNGPSVNTL
jgi:hypothetical protein